LRFHHDSIRPTEPGSARGGSPHRHLSGIAADHIRPAPDRRRINRRRSQGRLSRRRAHKRLCALRCNFVQRPYVLISRDIASTKTQSEISMTTATLQGRTALVTGGSRGIGAAISKALAQAGAAVAINYRERAGEANRLVEIIAKAGGRAVAIPADVSQTPDVANMVARVKSELGPIDVLINNAGIAITHGIDDLSESDFDQ